MLTKEPFPWEQGVAGSNLAAPTMNFKGFSGYTENPFFVRAFFVRAFFVWVVKRLLFIFLQK